MKYKIAGKRVCVAGHKGMAGSAVSRRLSQENCEILPLGRETLDFLDQKTVIEWFKTEKPDAVIVAAAKVGGILANSQYPADFLYQNLMIETNIINAAFQSGVEKLVFLGSSCIYPKFAAQPIREESLLTGSLEPTNEWYAIAKIAGIKLCEAFRIQYGCDYISAMPTNLYGPGDNFDLQTSHVLPALIRKAHEAKLSGAKEMEIWGTGSPRREFLHADDCADAIVFLLENYSDRSHVNVGSGKDLTILELAEMICDIVGFDGQISKNTDKPDGTPRKLMSADKLLALGWQPQIELRQGITETYDWFLSNCA